MNWHTKHPARNHAFLSRLHDGDLSPAERAHFEAHRAHCAECRSTANEFEHALSLFRSAGSAPPPADMAGRVLRKVRSVGQSRRTPFGDLFAIDLRWAGGFAVALLILIIAAPFALRQQTRVPAEGPITVTLQQRDAAVPASPDAAQSRQEAQAAAAAPPEREPARRKAAAAPPPAFFAEQRPAADARPSSSMSERRERDELAAANQPAPELKAQAQAPPAPPPPSVASGRFQAPQAKKLAQQNAAAQEKQGGEGARESNANYLLDGVSVDRPTRVVVSPLDGMGSPPELAVGPDAAELSHLRGRSFLVIVNGQGRVIELRAMEPKIVSTEDAKPHDNAPVKEGALAKDKERGKNEMDPIRGLRFAAGQKARRLLVRVE